MNIRITEEHILTTILLLACALLLSACQEGYQVHARTHNVEFSEISRFEKIWRDNSYDYNFERVEGEKYYKSYYKKFPLNEGAIYVTSNILCSKGYMNGLCEELEIETGVMRGQSRDDVLKEIESISIQLVDELKSIVGEENVEVTVTKMGPPIF